MKQYDRDYFDRWYRGDEAPSGEGALRRNVGLAVAVAESVLDRPIETVLDVGCGEGRWQPILSELRPELSYLGIEPSKYAVRRFGEARNIREGSFGELELHTFDDPFDLVICADVLHYLSEREILRGLPVLSDLVGGAALVEVFTSGDDVLGDRDGFLVRDPDWYRSAFQSASLVSVGLQMYVQEEMAAELDAMDLPVHGPT